VARKIDVGLMMIPLIVVGFWVAGEFVMSKSGVWGALTKKYRSKSVFRGKWKGCRWAQFSMLSSGRRTIVTYGNVKSSVLPPSVLLLGIAPEGLYLKRRLRNFLHAPLLVPWSQIGSAEETGLGGLMKSESPIMSQIAKSKLAGAVLGAADALTGKLIELRLEEPADTTIGVEREALNGAERYLGAKLKAR